MKGNWNTAKLGEVCDFAGGSQPPKSQFLYEPKNGYIRFLQIRDFDSEKYITYIPDSPKNRLCTDQDIMIGRYGASVGKILCGKAGAYNVALMKATPDLKLFERQFFFYYLLSDEFQDRLRNVADRSAQNGFSKEDIIGFPVPIPSRNDQKQIVAALDEAFDGIAVAKANTEKNLQNVHEIFDNYLHSAFSESVVNWNRKTLGQLIELGWIEDHMDGNHGGDYPRKSEFTSAGIPYISANCVDGDNIDMSRAKFLTPKRADKLRKGFARNDDVLFAHNATVGPVALLHTKEERVILGTSLTYYRCNRKHILPEYLAHYMRSSGFRKQYEQVMRQSTRNQVPITKQREFFHVIPPIEDQKRIIGTLDGLLESSQNLYAVYENKITALDELKRSLLHHAFTGKL